MERTGSYLPCRVSLTPRRALKHYLKHILRPLFYFVISNQGKGGRSESFTVSNIYLLQSLVTRTRASLHISITQLRVFFRSCTCVSGFPIDASTGQLCGSARRQRDCTKCQMTVVGNEQHSPLHMPHHRPCASLFS